MYKPPMITSNSVRVPNSTFLGPTCAALIRGMILPNSLGASKCFFFSKAHGYESFGGRRELVIALEYQDERTHKRQSWYMKPFYLLPGAQHTSRNNSNARPLSDR